MVWSTPQIALRRTLDDEDPYLANIELFACNRVVSVRNDLIVTCDQLLEMSRALRGFPKQIPDRYDVSLAIVSTSGTLVFGAYTVGSLGHVAFKVKSGRGWAEPNEAVAEFSIVAEPASVERFSQALATFSKWKHAMLRWTPRQCELFEEYQSDL